MVDLAADQHQLIFAIPGPVGVVDGKAFSRQMEHVAAFAFVEPEDSFGSEHLLGHLVVEEVLELAQCEGHITLERQGGESLDVLMVTVVVAVVMVSMAVAVVMVPMAVVMTVFMPINGTVGGGTHLVGFEQSDTEQQGQGHVTFH